mmetsp:Transcript_77965/g.210851  ORF Transcript_77965/g.210851 Transcript_77965/m.210851 type:complete len:317 (-) Transcript_77965:71-1021(-)
MCPSEVLLRSRGEMDVRPVCSDGNGRSIMAMSVVVHAERPGLDILSYSPGWLALCSGRETTLEAQLGVEIFAELRGVITQCQARGPGFCAKRCTVRKTCGRLPDGTYFKAKLSIEVVLPKADGSEVLARISLRKPKRLMKQLAMMPLRSPSSRSGEGLAGHMLECVPEEDDDVTVDTSYSDAGCPAASGDLEAARYHFCSKSSSDAGPLRVGCLHDDAATVSPPKSLRSVGYSSGAGSSNDSWQDGSPRSVPKMGTMGKANKARLLMAPILLLGAIPQLQEHSQFVADGCPEAQVDADIVGKVDQVGANRRMIVSL